MMEKTILYLSGERSSTCLVTKALETTGSRVVSGNSSSQGMALLFLIKSVAAVVIDDEVRKTGDFDVACSMRAIRPQLVIILRSGSEVETLPKCFDACVNAEQPFEDITSSVGYLLNG
jgi:hypothetical protein